MIARLSGLLFLLMALAGCQGQNRGIAADSDGEALDASASGVSLHEEPTDVVFVCQYGYAKSLVSSRHFERMAKDRGIPVRAIARGITPNDSVPGPLAAALSGDGFGVESYQPQTLGTDDLADADYVVSFGNEVPESAGASRMDWSDVSALSVDYLKARNEIVAHLSNLLDEIEADRARPQ